MTMDRDLVLRARMRLLSHDRQILHAPDGLAVYRLLFAVSPQVYASRLAYVLEESSRSAQVAHLPGRRRALLEEALAALALVPAHHPHRAKVLERVTGALRRLEPETGPDAGPGPEAGR
ncbi:hypothetical protein PUR71_11075 [Streptomyces sp. SP17BM10]|uniref:hypothetical protein n=1 Tax=Streptomyces sp. SP17BM10 TaxID=3002530 RepID=UPI002E75F8B8|nr:hypothetical protein [Streptomyces sp. SP17BM10]MEE1783451.1 hypothetical protein [Streptomyces sp. SP17BM10]